MNKTESAVRIEHLPTGITVTVRVFALGYSRLALSHDHQCQQSRQQWQNRKTAMSLLKSKLYDMELKKR